VGRDFPDEHVGFLRDRGIDVSGLEVVDGETFSWSGYYDFDLNTAHSRETRLNVFEEFKPRLTDAHSEADYVFLANMIPTFSESARPGDRAALTVLDTMNYWIENKRDSLIDTSVGSTSCS